MVEVCRMPSYPATDSLRCESYTTPRKQSDDDDTSKLTKGLKQTTDRVIGDDQVARNRDGARSAPPAHFSAQFSESLIEKLIEDSEQCSLDDTLVFESAVYDDWCEAASGWHQVVPYPKYITKQQTKSESSTKKGSGKRVSVRCVDDDYGNDLLCPAWKANVEPVTYRYIPNNGCYRSRKTNSKELREWLLVKKGRSERALVTPEVRQAQKTLKRDLDSHFKGGLDPSSSTGPPSQELPEDQCDTACGDQVKDAPVRTYAYSGKRLPPREQTLMKSASDLFMENFNTRLNALEKELKTSYSPAQPKKLQDNAQGFHLSTLSMNKKARESRVPDTQKSTAQEPAPNIGDDLFTVIPMCRPDVPLRPLERLTPKQKLMDQSPNVSADRTPSPLPSQEDETHIILASATSQPQPTQRDSDSNRGIDTARSAIAMTNIDIEKMRMHPSIDRNIPLRSDFRSRAKSFLVQQGHAIAPPTGRRGAMRYTTVPQSQDQGSVSTVEEESVASDVRPAGKARMKDMDSLGGSLPEIMGKRLTVATTTHRLL